MPNSVWVEPRRHRPGKTDGCRTLEKIVETHGPVVHSMARRIRASIPKFACIELKDLIQAGNVGLVTAVRSYSAESGVPCEIYARFRIRGEMLDTLRKLDAASRSVRNWHRKIRRTTVDLAAQLNREPTEEEVGTKLGLDPDSLRQKNLAIRAAYAVTRSSQCSDRMEQVSRVQADPINARPDSLQSEQERRKIVTFAVNQLPERPKHIIFMYYHQGYKLREIGEILGLEESRVCQIHKSALRLMAENLRMTGIRSRRDL